MFEVEKFELIKKIMLKKFKKSHNKIVKFAAKLLWVNFSINNPKMAQFLKLNFLITLKLNFNGGRFYKKILNFGYFKKLKKIVKFAVKKNWAFAL